MSVRRQFRGSILVACIIVVLAASSAPAAGQDVQGAQTVFLPLITRDFAPAPQLPADINDIQAYINYFRAWAGAPPIVLDAILNNNCREHARYMAETGDLTHDRSSSAAGLICAQQGNAWLGGGAGAPFWQPHHSVEGWMASVGHRLWLLYPTTPVFGYGFHASPAHGYRAGAALDVLSRFNEGTSYPGWPVRYPGINQTGMPATRLPITLQWRYFGPAPSVSSTSLTTIGGAAIAHSVTTTLPVGHKGINLLPNNALPANTTFTVSVSGVYSGAPFTYTWSFSTGN